MHVDFIADDPRHKARKMMEFVMNQGVDQLVIATGFCTAAGVQLLLSHAARLRSPDSFVVAPSSPPTDYKELSKLHSAIPNNLYIHWGSLAPVEKKAGAALMHSKIIYARSGQVCWLWTGSHNFTANATQGGNCEAAVLMKGLANEKPFIKALEHLLVCRGEATPYDPDASPPNSLERDETLALHVEEHVAIENIPCRIHLCLESADYDHLLTTPISVRLFIYPRGALVRGWQNAAPIGAFSGVLTGVNLTSRNPKARQAGTIAEWSAAELNIEEKGSTLVLTRPTPPSSDVATQAVISIDAVSNPDETLFSERPRVEQRPLGGTERIASVDPDMRKFFRSSDVPDGGLRHVPIVGREQLIRVVDGDLRWRDMEMVRSRISGREQVAIVNDALPVETTRRRHPFIVRTKYRLS